MARVNEHYLKLQGAYLFPEIDRRVQAFMQRAPEAADRVIRCGIGDVTEPLPAAILEAMHGAVDDMSRPETFKGYGPPLGYGFLREAIAAGDFAERGIDIAPDEIFISDGSKVDCGVLQPYQGETCRKTVPPSLMPSGPTSYSMVQRPRSPARTACGSALEIQARPPPSEGCRCRSRSARRFSTISG